ncbi:hypothetical protein OGM63_26190 [Plectonema radiosum NIES-515]|uniref:Transposase n=1 Tax=Plectonema radiosum NIES-515 TaxID=2986073 RepID=A0ABT3B7U7_9CYAN|nr:hypothetical protein [Plectonema radiosum]MCV3216954.1 hypothetical protein [Plectonema radiosum NIES-515]
MSIAAIAKQQKKWQGDRKIIHCKYFLISRRLVSRSTVERLSSNYILWQYLSVTTLNQA